MTGRVEQHPPPPVRLLRAGSAKRDRALCGGFEVISGEVPVDDRASRPHRGRRHMMVVADLASGDGGAIEDALMAAWALQAGHG